MFEDTNPNQQLPTGQPSKVEGMKTQEKPPQKVEDIFADTEESIPEKPMESEKMPTMGQPMDQQIQQSDASMPTAKASFNDSSSLGKKIIIVVIIVLAVAAIGFGTYWYYNKLLQSRLDETEKGSAMEKSQEINIPATSQPSSEETIPPAVNVEQPRTETVETVNPEEESEASTESTTSEVENTTSSGVTETPVNIPPIDVDGDGLTDVEELEAGTDPNLSDTDGDGLLDNEEINTYKTDPTDVDTDDDGYNDGEEVKNGYNPAGPGKL